MHFPETSRPLLPTPWAQLVSVVFGVLPMYALAFLSGLQSLNGGTFEAPDFRQSLVILVTEPLFFGALILFFLYVVCGSRLSALQTGKASWMQDIAQGITIAWLLIGAQIALGLILNSFLNSEIPESNVEIARTMMGDPQLILLWLGPMIWIKAAFLEEFSRAFLLTMLWQVWPSAWGRWSVLLTSAVAFGFGHIYQGAIGVAGTALIGLILGWYYMKDGRILPLIVAHGLYDTVILLVLLSVVKSGGI